MKLNTARRVITALEAIKSLRCYLVVDDRNLLGGSLYESKLNRRLRLLQESLQDLLTPEVDERLTIDTRLTKLEAAVGKPVCSCVLHPTMGLDGRKKK